MNIRNGRRPGPGRPKAEDSRQLLERDAQIAYFHRELGKPIEYLALRFQISTRTVIRALNRTEPVKFLAVPA